MLKFSETQLIAYCICPICGKNTKSEVVDCWVNTESYSNDLCIGGIKCESIVQCNKCNKYFDIDMLT